MKNAHKKWRLHKQSSKQRGIQFLLTFQEWLYIWVMSGYASERGRRVGQYVMARYGDKGSYSTNNVRIITCSENHFEKFEHNWAICEIISLRTKLVSEKTRVAKITQAAEKAKAMDFKTLRWLDFYA